MGEKRKQMQLTLVLQGEGYYTYTVGGVLVVHGNAGDNNGGDLVRNFLEIIANSLRNGCRLIQLVDVHEDAADRLVKELSYLAEKGEYFHFRRVERSSGYPNWNITWEKN